MIIIPVIHWKSPSQAEWNLRVALDAGCPGAILINMGGEGRAMVSCLLDLRERYPDALLGVNLLGAASFRDMLNTSRIIGLDATWTDEQLTHSSRRPVRPDIPTGHLVFCAVAFKYQQHEPDPVTAARTAVRLGMVPTTSGAGTGEPVDPDHLRLIREGIGPEAPLAVASGVTPENVHLVRPYLTHALVATGISANFHNLDPARTRALVEAAR